VGEEGWKVQRFRGSRFRGSEVQGSEVRGSEVRGSEVQEVQDVQGSEFSAAAGFKSSSASGWQAVKSRKKILGLGSEIACFWLSQLSLFPLD